MAAQPEPSKQPHVEAEPPSGWLASVNPVVQLGRLLPTALQDLRRIADGMAVLPELLRELTAIRERVAKIDDEVSVMRRGVNELDGQVGALQESVETELRDVGLAMHPLRRTTRRLRRRDTTD